MLVICAYVTMMLFSGFLIDLESIVPFLRWIKWFSAFRYASHVLAINEFRNLTLCLSSDLNFCMVKGEEILARKNIVHFSWWDVWNNLFALLLMTLVFFLLAFFQLLMMKKFKWYILDTAFELICWKIIKYWSYQQSGIDYQLKSSMRIFLNQLKLVSPNFFYIWSNCRRYNSTEKFFLDSTKLTKFWLIRRIFLVLITF